jgi:nucleotide-binding universal stress UspA family protein
MSATKVIVVPLIGKKDARAAVNYGRSIAKTRSSILQLLYLGDKEEDPAELIATMELSPEDLFNAVVSQVHCPKEDYDKAIITAASRPEVELLIFSDGDDIPYLTTQIVDKVECPLMLIQSESIRDYDKPIEQILVPVDCTPSSAGAIEPAVLIAAEAGAKLHVLHIADRETATEPGSLPLGPYMDQAQHEWPHWIREFWDRFIICVKEIAPQVEFQLHVSRGDIKEEILTYVNTFDVDLVTMAAGVESGDMINSLISKLPCPLLLVRPGKVRHKVCEIAQTFAA